MHLNKKLNRFALVNATMNKKANISSLVSGEKAMFLINLSIMINQMHGNLLYEISTISSYQSNRKSKI